MNQQEQHFDFGIEIELKKPDDFLKIKETLTRMGIKSKKANILYQSVHILHKRGRYFLLSFKEFFMLDNKQADFTDDDYRRRNMIGKLLQQWGLCKIVNPTNIEMTCKPSELDIIPYKNKNDYQLVAKYTVGAKKKTHGQEQDH